jgi:two-component system, OmpR family, sensor histidine kinase RstB
LSRLVLRITLGLVFVLVASFFIVRWGAMAATRGAVRDHFRSHVNTVAKAHYRLDKAPPERLEAELADLRKRSKHSIRLLDPTQDKIPDEVRQAWLKNEPRVIWRKNHSATVWVPVRNNTRILAVGRRPLHWDHVPLAKVVVALFGVVALTGFALAWPLVRRLRRLARVADRISVGEMEARADVSSKDAVGRLARRFNAMADQIQLLLEKQQQLVQGVSHELRTPATRIRFGLEMLTRAKTEDERNQRIDAMDEDLDELDRLVGELLLYIKSGDRALGLERQEVEASKELRTLVDRQGEQRSDIEISLRSDDGEVTASADLLHFRRALRNLLDNALRHAKSRVTVDLRRENDGVLVAVSDDGPGVDPQDRERIFEPFSRVDASRSRESGGTGLGLAIVQRILEAHGGAVTVKTAAEGGARFETHWPDVAPETPDPSL